MLLDFNDGDVKADLSLVKQQQLTAGVPPEHYLQCTLTTETQFPVRCPVSRRTLTGMTASPQEVVLFIVL